MNRLVKKISFLVTVSVAFCMPRSEAAILELEESFSGIPDYSSTLVFAQFNPLWGVINAITITLKLYADGGELRVDNDSGTAATSDVSFGAQAVLSSTDVVLLNNMFQSVVGTVVASTTASLNTLSDDGDLEVGGTANFSSQGSDYGELTGDSVLASNAGNIGALFLEGFTGTGSFDIDVNASQFLQLGGLSGAQRQIFPLSSSGTVVVAYDYTGDGPPPESSVVPEPSVVTFFAGALCLLFVMNRRKYRRH